MIFSGGLNLNATWQGDCFRSSRGSHSPESARAAGDSSASASSCANHMCQVGSQIQEVTKDASESSWPSRLIIKQIDYLGSI